MTKNITVNTQSSIKIAGEMVLRFDPLGISAPSHDADVIFITHEHYDHFSPEDIEKVKKPETVLVAPAAMADKAVAESGISGENCVFVEPGKNYEIAGLLVEAVPAYNENKQFHPKGNNWCGYIVTMDDIRYYVAGDTDCIPEGESYTCDVAMFPIGGTYTMTVNEAVAYMELVQPKIAVPTHYGSIVGNPTDGTDFKALMQTRCPDIQVELKL